MLAIEAECQAEEKGLLGVLGEALVGEIAEFVGFEIQNREGLFFSGGVGAKTAVKEDGIATIGRNGGGRGEIINAARIAGHFAEKLAVGHLRVAGWRCLLGSEIGENTSQAQKQNCTMAIPHPGIIGDFL